MAEAASGGGGGPLKETKRETVEIPATIREGEAAAEHKHVDAPSEGFPTELADRYRVVKDLGGGGQADVWLAEDSTGTQVMVKVYGRGIEVNSAVLNKLSALARAGRKHLVGLLDHGKAHGRLYEVQEYLEHGSLADLVDKRHKRSPVPIEFVRAVVSELTGALQYLHKQGIDHQDLKPSNVFLRSESPLNLVLGDFGTSSRVATTVRQTKLRAMTWQYAPPEAFARDEVTLQRHMYDWWALGMMVVEMLTGCHPLPKSLPAITNWMLTRNLDELVEGVSDPAWRTLCRGLLRRDPENRWGESQVQRWLQNPQDSTLAVADESAPPRRGFRFVGNDYETLAALAAAFANDWSSAAKVWTERNAELQSWVRDELGGRDVAERLDEIDRAAELNLEAQLFFVIRALDATALDSFQGVPLTEDGLAGLADRAVSKPNERDGRVLRALQASRILEIEHEDVPALGALAKSWAGVLAAYNRLRREFASQKLPLSDEERTWLIAAATPGSGVTDSLRARVRQVLKDDQPRARACGWFQRLGSVADAAGPSLLAMIYLAESAHTDVLAEQEEKGVIAAEDRARWVAGATWGAAVGVSAGLLYLAAVLLGFGWTPVVVLGLLLGAAVVRNAPTIGCAFVDRRDLRACLIGGGLGAVYMAAWFWAMSNSFERLVAWLPGSWLTTSILSGFLGLGLGVGVIASLRRVRDWMHLAFTWREGTLGALLLTMAVSGSILVAGAAVSSEEVAGAAVSSEEVAGAAISSEEVAGAAISSEEVAGAAVSSEEAVREEDAVAALEGVPAETDALPPSPAAVEGALNLDLSARRRIQEGLAAAGFDLGLADGAFGARTRAAIQAWQRDRNAAVTGYLNMATAMALTTLAADAVRQADEEVRRSASRARPASASMAARAPARGPSAVRATDNRAADVRPASSVEPVARLTDARRVVDPPPIDVEAVVPAESYIQVQVDTEISSVTARVEDNVRARVTRDVVVGDRVVIPVGTVVMGSVTRMTQGGRFRGASRIGVRFHTIVFAAGAETPIRTETIYREASGEGGDTARKVGIGTVAGAVVGGVLGGARGAAKGAAAGAAGGTAVAAADGAAAATVAAGEAIDLRLIRPVTVNIAR